MLNSHVIHTDYGPGPWSVPLPNLMEGTNLLEVVIYTPSDDQVVVTTEWMTFEYSSVVETPGDEPAGGGPGGGGNSVRAPARSGIIPPLNEASLSETTAVITNRREPMQQSA